MAASNTRFTQNSLGQSKNPIDSDHGIYRYNGASSSRWTWRRGGCVAAAARAQQATMPLIGFLGLSSPDAFSPRLAAFSAWRYPISQAARSTGSGRWWMRLHLPTSGVLTGSSSRGCGKSAQESLLGTIASARSHRSRPLSTIG